MFLFPPEMLVKIFNIADDVTLTRAMIICHDWRELAIQTLKKRYPVNEFGIFMQMTTRYPFFFNPRLRTEIDDPDRRYRWEIPTYFTKMFKTPDEVFLSHIKSGLFKTSPLWWMHNVAELTYEFDNDLPLDTVLQYMPNVRSLHASSKHKMIHLSSFIHKLSLSLHTLSLSDGIFVCDADIDVLIRRSNQSDCGLRELQLLCKGTQLLSASKVFKFIWNAKFDIENTIHLRFALLAGSDDFESQSSDLYLKAETCTMFMDQDGLDMRFYARDRNFSVIFGGFLREMRSSQSMQSIPAYYNSPDRERRTRRKSL